jgi:hypothetical protein
MILKIYFEKKVNACGCGGQTNQTKVCYLNKMNINGTILRYNVDCIDLGKN